MTDSCLQASQDRYTKISTVDVRLTAVTAQASGGDARSTTSLPSRLVSAPKAANPSAQVQEVVVQALCCGEQVSRLGGSQGR